MQRNVNDKHFEVVTSAKIVGMTITDDLKWNVHVANILLKASKRLYLLKQLKRANVDTNSLIKFYTAPVSDLFSSTLVRPFTQAVLIIYQKKLNEFRKEPYIRIIYPYMDYGEALKMGNLERLKDRREKLCEKLFREIEENEDHKLHGLLPEMNKAVHIFKTIRKYNLLTIRTNRFKDSFILEYASRKEIKTNLF